MNILPPELPRSLPQLHRFFLTWETYTQGYGLKVVMRRPSQHFPCPRYSQPQSIQRKFYLYQDVTLGQRNAELRERKKEAWDMARKKVLQYLGKNIVLLRDLNKRPKQRYIYSWIDILNIVNMSVLPKVIYKLSANPIKIPRGIFVNMDKLILKYIWKSKGPSQHSKTILEEKKIIKRISRYHCRTEDTEKYWYF